MFGSHTRQSGLAARIQYLLAVVLLAGCANLSAAPVSAQGYTVLVENHPELGLMLTDPNGMSLYTHEGETESNLVCTDACLSEWHPYALVEGEPAAPPELTAMGSSLGVITRQNGTRQVTFDGQPLYYWHEDTARGDTLGNAHDGRTFVANLPVIRVADHPEHGQILVGPTGMTLYTFELDREDQWACEEGCLQRFPPLLVSGPVRLARGLSGSADTFERSPDDTAQQRLQVRYDSMPLYYFSRDEAPGDTLGHGLAGHWAVARP